MKIDIHLEKKDYPINRGLLRSVIHRALGYSVELEIYPYSDFDLDKIKHNKEYGDY